MFSKKIIWLCILAVLPLSLPVEAADAQLLIDRAHYWSKLGRSELAVFAWQDLLLVEPDNAEALAALSQAAAAVESVAVVAPAVESVTAPVVEPAPVTEPVA
ncbi:MAG: hypothetical protein NTY60_04610, partial [Proteobacteria bacterium]|nr:hypothetical protein [Pseudomonadota bacterium]